MSKHTKWEVAIHTQQWPRLSGGEKEVGLYWAATVLLSPPPLLTAGWPGDRDSGTW